MLLAVFCAFTARFLSDLVKSHIVGFPTRRLIFLCRYRIALKNIALCTCYIIHLCLQNKIISQAAAEE